MCRRWVGNQHASCFPLNSPKPLPSPVRPLWLSCHPTEFQLVLQQTATQQQEAARSSAFHHPTAGRPEESRLLPPLEEQPHAGPPHAEQDAPGSADAPFASAHPALVRAMSGLQRSAQQGSGGVTTVAADLRRQPSAPVRVPAGPPLGQHGAAGPAGTASPRLPRVPSEPPPRLSESSAGTGTRSSSLTPAQLSAQQAQQQEDLAAEQEQAQQQLAADHAGQLEQLGARQRQQTAALSVRQQGEQLVLDMQQEEERQEQEQQDSLSEELRQLSQDSLTLQLQSQAPSQQQQQCVAEAGAPAQPGGQDSSRLNAVQLQGSQEAPGASYAHVRAFLARSAELATSPSFTSPFAQQPQPSLAAAAPAGSAQRAAPPVVASPFAQQAQQPSLERPPATPPPQQRISPPFVSPFAAAAPSPFAAAAAQESEPAPGPPPPPAV